MVPRVRHHSSHHWQLQTFSLRLQGNGCAPASLPESPSIFPSLVLFLVKKHGFPTKTLLLSGNYRREINNDIRQ
ncbi:unnamed protein product [Pleuronectes platessa]|uniref:Uncharacterized protein n=1 Tax=Pleuronectes platessa TaxID=8262 RepID=A0A9N7U4A1_PLEPL|nr:unnamed protein product [Pleuronectes platessa]